MTLNDRQFHEQVSHHLKQAGIHSEEYGHDAHGMGGISHIPLETGHNITLYHPNSYRGQGPGYHPDFHMSAHDDAALDTFVEHYADKPEAQHSDRAKRLTYETATGDFYHTGTADPSEVAGHVKKFMTSPEFKGWAASTFKDRRPNA